MLDLHLVCENPDQIKNALLQRRDNSGLEILEQLFPLAEQRKSLIQNIQSKREELNRHNEKIKISAQKGEKDTIAQAREGLRKLSDAIKTEDEQLGLIETKLNDMLLRIPNIPDSSTPIGKDSDDNPVVSSWGKKTEFSFQPKEHSDLAESLGIISFSLGAKITGSRFSCYFGLGARLERALINFMLDTHINEHGYTEVLPPFLVNSASLTGTGQLPKFVNDVFHVPHQDTELFLIPTAEVPVTNIYRDEIIEDEKLPIKFVSYTPCFRSEAGSYGKDIRGLIRQHQFNKVELVMFARPEESQQAHQNLLGHAEQILRKLHLHYRVVQLCTGDLGFAAQKCYDIEVWLPGQQKYREISSCSNFGDYQSRRAKIRYRPQTQKKAKFVHTLNGSGLAVGRTVVAILEQYQQEDGSILIPQALIPYMGGVDRIEK